MYLINIVMDILMKKRVLAAILISITGQAWTKETGGNYCGYWKLQNEGIYDGFILSANSDVQILSIDTLNSEYYVQGNIIHIPHSLGGEFLLEIKNKGQQLQGQDFWTKGAYYEKESNKGCSNDF